MKDDSKPIVVARGKFLRLQSIDGWEYVERANASAVVGMLAITDDDRLVLVEQYRPAVRKRVIELPAGLAGDSKEHQAERPETAAERELLEETGYRAREMLFLGSGPSSSGMSSEIITLYHAKGLTKMGAGEGDGLEQITLHEVPMRDLRAWLGKAENDGKLIDLRISAALNLAGIV
jgi:ADP-ribose pyrophosphatase